MGLNSIFCRTCRCLAAIVFILGAISAAAAQNYSWMEMPQKDAQRLLTNSPWSQVQVDTDVSEMFYSPTKQGSSSSGRSNAPKYTDQQKVNNNRADRGAVNQAISISYRISFLSARPIRQAFAKMVLSSQNEPNDRLAQDLQAFVERDFSPFVVIAVTPDAPDRRFLGPIMQELESATTATLHNNVYLERVDGKRVFLTQYSAPIADGLGAKFIFPRMVDGVPFLSVQSGTVRFIAQFGDTFKLNMQFKVADMIFDQKLEY